MGQRLIYYSELNFFFKVGVEKSSLNRAIVLINRPETGRYIHGQGEDIVKYIGGPNPLMLKN